jgi:ribosome-associated protein
LGEKDALSQVSAPVLCSIINDTASTHSGIVCNRGIMKDWYPSEAEIQISAIRAQGAGGQNVNKVASAVHLRFDIAASSLPDRVKARLLTAKDSRITAEGVLVIKAQSYRTQAANRQDAIDRLRALVEEAARIRPPRRATRPTLASKLKRVDTKTKQGRIKALRGRPAPDA